MDGGVNAVAIKGGEVYIGGYFTHICGNAACNSGNIRVNHIAKWNGSAWSALEYGVNDSVTDLAVSGSDLYVGGFFTQVCGNGACDGGNVNVARIAKWNGNQWAAVAHGVSDLVHALDVGGGAANKALVVGGGFTHVCGSASCILNNTRVNHIARYALNQPTPTPNVTPTTVCVAKPAKPTLKRPVNGPLVATNRPVLKWNAASCANTYTVVVKNTQTGQVADKVRGWVRLKFKTDALVGGVMYKWFVKACNTFGCTKSAVRTFTVP